MNLAHLHLLLNHIPTIGTAIGLALFTVALLKNSDELKRASLVIFVGIALAAIPTFTSGSAAQLKLCEAPRGMPCGDYPAGVSKSWIEAHENAALVAFSVLELAGGFAWLALWQYRRRSRASGGALAAVLVLALLSFGLMARAANIGGEIRHPEIRAGGAPAEAETLTRQLGAALSGGTQWAWPASETLHFIGLTLLFGVVLLVDLRMLGMMNSVPVGNVGAGLERRYRHVVCDRQSLAVRGGACFPMETLAPRAGGSQRAVLYPV
jgi:uncharacterized membrane protein